MAHRDPFSSSRLGRHRDVPTHAMPDMPNMRRPSRSLRVALGATVTKRIAWFAFIAVAALAIFAAATYLASIVSVSPAP